MNGSSLPPDHKAILDCLLSSAREGILAISREGAIKVANTSFCKWLGIEEETLLQQNLFTYMDEETGHNLRKLIASLKEREPTEGFFALSGAGNSTIEFKAQFGVPDSTRDIVCITCEDITGVQEDRRTARLTSNAFMAAANAIVICDTKGRVLKVNRAFTTFTGYTAKEVEGRSTKLLKSGTHPDQFYKDMWETITRGDVWQGEIVNKKKDGKLYTEDMTITPVYSEKGVIENYIAIKQDITDSKRLEDMYLRAQRLESVGTLSSGVAHDLNNVLSPIIMSADLILAQQEDEDLCELMTMIKDGAKRGADIVQQLLSFARGGESGQVEVQLNHILKEQTRVYRETFPKKITIELRMGQAPLPVLGDSTQLYQVFANLMINARDAMPQGGNLLVQTSTEVIDLEFKLSHPYAKEGTFTRVRIQDNGTGMSEEVQAKIFDTFFTTKLQGKGTGLGLPTSLSIIKNHGGFLTLDSTPNEGTTFDVYLPAVESQVEEEWPGKESGPPTGNGQNILVVDDEESIGYMLRGTLSTLGYHVEVATGGRDAIDWVSEHPGGADLLMLDMMMPDVDGAEVIQELRKSDLLPPVLIMSGMVPEEVLASTGVDLDTNFIAKPFTIQAVAEKIDRLLNTQHDGVS